MTSSAAQPKASILYVDDDLENRESFRAVFRREYDVHLAASADEAFAVLDGSPIQVLITDQRMPGVTGSQLLETIAERYPDMLRFMLTGFSDFDPLVDALNRGRLQGFFSKPLDVSLIRGRIEEGLSTFYLREKNRALQEALEKSEARLRAIFNQAAVGIAAVTPEGRFQMVNRKACHILGYSEKRLLSMKLEQVFTDESLHSAVDRLQSLMGEGADSLRIKSRVRREDHHATWVALTLSAERDDKNTTAPLIGVIEDITKRKKAEKAAREARRFSEKLLQTANALILGLDTAGDILLINPIVERLTGYSTGELTGRNWFDLMVPQTCRKEVWQEFRRLMEGGEPVLYENAILCRDGGERIISWSNSRLVEAGEAVGLLSVGIDITRHAAAEEEKKRLFDQLQQAQKMESIGTLAGGIAHDFNNILSPILGYAGLIAENAGSAKNSRYARAIYEAGMRARELISQVLTFSRKQEHEKKPIRVQTVVKEALKLLRASIPTTLSLHQHIDEDCCPIMGDETQVYQVIMNLCTNAFQAMKDREGEIGVSVQEVRITEEDQPQFLEVDPGAFTRVSVSDTGPGIDPAIIDRIFEPYFSTKQMESGTGLGLSVVHGIVKGHCGAIKVYSEPGKGTAFNVYLPCLAEAVDTRPVKTETAVSGKGESILVVDDEQSLVTLLADILTGLGYQVTGFTDSREALAAFRKQPDAFDLVFTDMTMPHMTGLQLAEAVLAEVPGKPVVVCTGFSERLHRSRIREKGIRRMVMKPIVKSEIAEALREVLDHG